MDEVVAAVAEVKKQWDETWTQIQGHIRAIEEYGKSRDMSGVKNSLPRLNGLAQDGLAVLSSLQLKLDVLAPQLPTYDEVQSAQELVEKWKEQSQTLRLALRNANLQAKANMKKTAQEERKAVFTAFFGDFLKGVNEPRISKRALLFGGGTESTTRRRDLQTKAGMTSAAESITESLRRTRQLMHQEVERSATTLMTFDDSTGVLKKAEKEYTGHKSLLSRTRNLLSTMQRQDIIDRVIITIGFIAFSLAVLYVVSKRIGILKLQRLVIASIKGGMVKRADIARQPAPNGPNIVQHDNIPPTIAENLVENLAEHVLHDEL